MLDYTDLEKKAQAATDTFNRLSTEIKTAEKRMAEIAVLKSHIANYAKTRDVYTDYRKAGYSRSFFEEHTADLILHKAAKSAFNELGAKKLPTMKALQTEYAELLSCKKKSYGEYQKVKKEMQETITAKANVDRILGEDTAHLEKEKSQEQR